MLAFFRRAGMTVALATVAAPVLAPVLAQGRTPVKTQVPVKVQVTRTDTSVRTTMVPLTLEQMRMLAAAIAEVSARNAKLETEIIPQLSDPTRARAADARLEEIAKTTLEMLSKQRILMMSCLEMRSRDEQMPGMLGVQLNDSVHWVLRTEPGQRTLTMLFSTTPRIVSVDPGSPAERAGARPGDVWVAVNGRQLADSVRFDELLYPGSSVALRVARDGREIELPPATVAQRPPSYPGDICDPTLKAEDMLPFGGRNFVMLPKMFPAQPPIRKPVMRDTTGASPQISVFMLGPRSSYFAGASLQSVDDDWRGMLGYTGNGVVITEVGPGSPAEGAGLRKFDVITRVNDQAVSTPVALQKFAGDERTIVLTVGFKGEKPRKVTISR